MKALTELKKVMRNLWARIAAFIILRRIQSIPDSPLDFGRLMEQPEDWLIMMPVEANAFDAAMMYCRELLESLKGVRLHLVVPDEFRHWVTTSPSLKVHPFHRQDLFLGRFPRHSFLQRVRRIGPVVAVDLSPCSTPLSLSVCGLCGARVRGSLSRVDGDAVFNFLVKTRAGELGDRYRALFAYLS
jgi:hypothetical protein